jgi:hypothetical protein
MYLLAASGSIHRQDTSPEAPARSDINHAEIQSFYQRKKIKLFAISGVGF